MGEKSGSFTEEEKVRLARLVRLSTGCWRLYQCSLERRGFLCQYQIEVNGRDFTTIGRLMDKAPGTQTDGVLTQLLPGYNNWFSTDDCRQMATRLHERKRSGRYSAGEDQRIVDCVRRLVASEGTD